MVSVRQLIVSVLAFTCFSLQISAAPAAGKEDLSGRLEQDTLQQRMNDFRAAKLSAQVARNPGDLALSRNKMGRYIRDILDQKAASAVFGKEAEQASSTAFKLIAQGNPFIRTQEGDIVQVYVYTQEINQALRDKLELSGLDIEIVNESLMQVQGWIAIDKLDQLARLPEVRKVKAPNYGRSNRGSVTTQGDAILKADKLREKGLTGKGIRIGIISDGANDWANSRASGDLPAGGITRYGSCTKQAANPAQCSGGSSCNEGTAMAEIIYDIVPDAKLAVASASTSLEFIQRVNQLANTFGADVIVDDLGFYGEPYFEDGDIAKAVAAVAKKVLYVSSAGNSGDSHYEKNYRAIPFSRIHDFGRAEGKLEDNALGVLIPAQSSLLTILQWNDPFDASRNDYDLALFDLNGNLVALSEEEQDGPGSSPLEAFYICNSGSVDRVFLIVINRFSGAGKRLELFNLGRGAQEYVHPDGSVFGHAGAPLAVAVGSINADESGHNNIAFYSSRGPARVDYPSISNRKKPDIIGIDGVSVTGVGGFPSTFYGTSASAPHVAAIGAQLMSRSPWVTAESVRKALMGAAVDLGSNGFDTTYGYGRVDADASLALLKYGVPVPGAVFLLTD